MSKTAKPTIKSVVLDYIETNGTKLVDDAEFAAIRREAMRRSKRETAPSVLYLMDILSAADIAIDRRIGGVPADLRNRIRTGTLQEARESLVL